MKTEYKHIFFRTIPQVKKRKTQIWGCYNNTSGICLAEIKWYSPWRQYCFFTQYGCVFNKVCLNDIIDFINQLKEIKK